MTSKSYFAIVLSSFLGAALSCSAQDFEKSEERRLEVSSGEPEEPTPDLPEKTEESPEGFDMEGGEVASVGKSQCAKGSMHFEGRCVHKDEVDRILEDRERKALKRVQQAEEPDDAAHAAHDLLEQQIAQVDKTEDDLDEIIEELKEEKRKRVAKASAEKGPVGKEE